MNNTPAKIYQRSKGRTERSELKAYLKTTNLSLEDYDAMSEEARKVIDFNATMWRLRNIY